MQIRRTVPADIAWLPVIEAAAGQLFRSLPEIAWLADEDPISTSEHASCVASQLSWVAVDDEHEPPVVGFLIAKRHNNALHLTELSVHPDAQRRGIGAALLHRGLDQARQMGFEMATLTTFLDVPWNGPFYRRHGFEQVPDHDLTEELAQVLAKERAAGLPMDRRGAMRRHLD